MLVRYLVLSVLEHSLIGGRVFFSLGGEGGGENTVNLRIHHSHMVGCLYVNLNLTNQLADYLLHLPNWSNSNK